MKSIITILIMTLLASTTLATTIIVDPGGGGDATTIQGGLDLASAGDIVLVAPGTYIENVQMQSQVELRSKSGPMMTIIDGNGYRCVECIQCGNGTIIDGFTITNAGGYSAGGVWVFDHSNVEITNNIFIDNQTTYEGAGAEVQRYSYAHIHDNVFKQNTSLHSCAISVIVGSQATIENNVFKDNTSTFLSAGIGLNNSSTVIAGNTFIENHSVHGATIHAVHSFTFTVISNNSFVFNYGSADGGSGIYAYSGATMIANNNIFAFNYNRPAIFNAGAILELECNDIWENDIDYAGIPDPIGVNGNIGKDPMICEPLTDDVALSIYSPCLSAPCGVIGANPDPECTDAIPTATYTWGQLKAGYR